MDTLKTNKAIAAAMGGEAHRARADAFAATILPVIAEIRAAGARTRSVIAKALNARRITTARGGRWNSDQVRRVEERAKRQDPKHPVV